VLQHLPFCRQHSDAPDSAWLLLDRGCRDYLIDRIKPRRWVASVFDLVPTDVTV
jgi:hypothetical protein